MAIRYDNIEFDTVAELMEYKAIKNGKPKAPVAPKQGTRKPSAHVKKFIKRSLIDVRADKIKAEVKARGEYVRFTDLCEKFNIPPGGSQQNLINRFLNSVDFLVTRLGKFYYIGFLGAKAPAKEKRKGKTPKDHDKKANRLRFIQSRIKTLIKADPRLNYESAFRIASDEYQTGKAGKVTPKAPKKPKYEVLDFPTVYPLRPDSVPIFRDLVQNMIANKGRLSFLEVSTSLMVDSREHGDVMDGRNWSLLCRQFMLNSGKIAEYFNVKNKFKHTRENGFDILRYGGL